MTRKYAKHLAILLALIFVITFPSIYAQDYKIPQWIKNNALWWSEGEIDDASFLSGIKYLIENKIMIIPAKDTSSQSSLPFVPNWIKDTAGWWATGKVSDGDFVNGIKWLIENGIIQVSTTNLPVCSGEALCITSTVQRVIDGDTLEIQNYTVRLSLTSTPESDDPRYDEATEFTKALCPVGSQVIVDQDDLQPFDQYDRLLAKVFCNGKNLNAELLINGHGWILVEYCATSEFTPEPWAIDSCIARMH